MGAPVVTAIRAPSKDLDNHQIVLSQLKEETELGRRIRGDANNSFVTLGELISAGLVKYIDKVISPGNKVGGGGLSTVNVIDSITGDGSTGSPLKLVGDTASPTASQYYGTNAGSTRGWYNLPAGGGSLSVTDGTHTVTGTTSLTVVGAAVSGSTPNATITVSGGGTTQFLSGNLTVDTHPASPTPRDDEFEMGSLDPKWTWLNQNTATITWVNASGALKLTSSVQVAPEVNAITQPLVPALTAFEYRAKLSQEITTNFNNGGLILEESGTGKIIRFTIFYNAGSPNYDVTTFSNATTQVGSLASGAISMPFDFSSTIRWNYQRLRLAGGNYFWDVSVTGEEGTFLPIYSGSITAWFTTAADTIGMYVSGQNAGTASILYCDWFRDYTSGYSPATGYTLPQFNITPDTHQAGVQPFVANDEFEEAALDTGGTRFAGALPWSTVNFAGTPTPTALIDKGALIFTTDANGAVPTRFPRYVLQNVAAGAAWRYRAKMRFSLPPGSGASATAVQLCIYSSVSNASVGIGFFNNGSLFVAQINYPSFTTIALPAFTGASFAFNPLITADLQGDFYFELELSAGTLITRYSPTGYDSDFVQLFSPLTVATYFATPPDMIGFMAECCGVATPARITADWFRRMA